MPNTYEEKLLEGQRKSRKPVYTHHRPFPPLDNVATDSFTGNGVVAEGRSMNDTYPLDGLQFNDFYPGK